MMCAARNHVRSGRSLACITVPAVTEVWGAHPAHSQIERLRVKGQPLQVPQEGQTKPFGQRRSARYCAHVSSSRKPRVKRLAGHRSVGFPSGCRDRNIIGTNAPCNAKNSTSCKTGAKGIRLWRKSRAADNYPDREGQRERAGDEPGRGLDDQIGGVEADRPSKGRAEIGGRFMGMVVRLSPTPSVRRSLARCGLRGCRTARAGTSRTGRCRARP